MRKIEIKKEQNEILKDIIIDIIVDGKFINSIKGYKEINFKLSKESHIIELKINGSKSPYQTYGFLHVPYGLDNYSFVIVVKEDKIILI